MPNNSSDRVSFSDWLEASGGNFGFGTGSSPFGGASQTASLRRREPTPPPAPRAAPSRERVRQVARGAAAHMYYSDEIPDFAEPVASSDSNLSGNIEVNSEMATIAQIFGHRVSYPTIESHPLIVGTHLAGVEIELENLHIRRPSFNYWSAKDDGSLRNGGMEFVCSSPWGGIDLYNAALEIDSFMYNAKPEDTWRCSTHVHVDVRNMNVQQLKRMILAYALFERVLFKCSGWHRYKNNFCMALGFAQEQVNILSNAWNRPDSEFVSTLTSVWDKYSSINFLPMASFGSVEFRISEAKWRKGRLIRLVNRFLSLKDVAMEFNGTEEEFIEYLYEAPIHKMIRKGLPRNVPDLQEDMDFGYKLCHDIISMSRMRRRSIRTLAVDLDDGTRAYRANIFDAGWNHIRDSLRSRQDSLMLELPETMPDMVTFGWLYELRDICSANNIQWDIRWFPSRQLERQHFDLWDQYVSERRRGRDVAPVVEGDDDDEDSESPEQW